MAIPVFVICHTVLNDIFRNYPNATEEKKEQQKSAKFLLRYLIEKQSKIDIGRFISVTSERVMGNIDEKLPNQGVVGFKAQILIALRNLILTLDPNVENLDESVIIISDLLSSRIENIVLVSNMQKKIRHILAFYQKYEKTSREWKEKDIPFRIMDTADVEKLLRETDKETCGLIDKKLQDSS